jgi:hypothetical protein
MAEIIQAASSGLSERRLKRAQSQIVGLAIGVSEYPSTTGFGRLSVCSQDAASVREAFLDVPQLNADPSRLWSLTEKTNDKPTRNNMIGYLRQLATLATAEDRVIFFYSGHGVKLGDQLYLVPTDAYAADEADALLSIERVKEILEKSEARQKLIVLDCCYSGPDTSGFKTVPADISNNFLEKYLAETKGSVVLSSSAGDQVSWAKSPDSKLSLFTYYFLRSLRGEPESLDINKHLTLYSLHSYLSAHVDRRARSYHSRQRPGLERKINGDFLFADFSAPLLEIEGLQLGAYPIRELNFLETEWIQVKKLLTRMKRSPSNFSEEWLEKAANSNLGDHVQEQFGRLAAKFAKVLSFSLAEVTVDDTTLFFPDGSLSVEYCGDGKDSGTLEYVASFHGTWLAEAGKIEDALLALEMRPSEMTFEVNGKINLDRVRAGLPATGWEINSHLPHEVTASKSGYSVTASTTSITFTGFSPSELFSGENGGPQLALVTGVLKLLGA